VIRRGKRERARERERERERADGRSPPFWQVRNSYNEGTQELATREHIKFVLRAYEALRELEFSRPITSIILLYAIQRTNEAK
jgi:hypothetical protein